MSRSALVVGAGIAGLAATWWLTRSSWRVTVVERAPDLRADGYMLGLSGPGLIVAERMGLRHALEARSRNIHENLYLDRHGREIIRLRYRDFLRGIDWLTLTRTDLAAVLFDAVSADAEFCFGVSLEQINEQAADVEVTLSDGSRRSVDLVVGADGVRSRTRSLLFEDGGASLSYLGYRVAAFQLEDSLGLGADFLSYAEPSRLAEFYTLAEGRLATLYIWRSDDAGRVPTGDRRASLKAAFDGAHPNATRWIDLLPAGAPLFFDSMTLVELPRWSKGRCVLVGDSAHCLTLVSGQGAGIAMASASILAEELRKGGLHESLARYEARLRPAIGRLQRHSRKMAAVFIPASPFAFACRNLMLRHLPHRLLGWYLRRGIHTEIASATEGLELPPR